MFTACDVTAWASEQYHWISNGEKWDVKVRITLECIIIES